MKNVARELAKTAKAMVAKGKGILAIDEQQFLADEFLGVFLIHLGHGFGHEQFGVHPPEGTQLRRAQIAVFVPIGCLELLHRDGLLQFARELGEGQKPIQVLRKS